MVVSGTDWRTWVPPPRPMKRFSVPVEPDASLTLTGCAVAECGDRAALMELGLGATAFSPDGATGGASSHANTTPPTRISIRVMTEAVMSARLMIRHLILS